MIIKMILKWYNQVLLKTVFLLLLSSISSSGLAWSEKGHRIIAEITRHYLPKAILDSVQQHLGGANANMAFDYTLGVLTDETQNSIPHMHFTKLEKDQTTVANTGATFLSQFELVLFNLKTGYQTQESIRFHLKALYYLVGDLHQPLLVLSGSEIAQTKTHVTYMNEAISLQEAWDEKIIESEKINADNCLVIRLNTQQLSPVIAVGSLGRAISSNPRDWIQYSANLCSLLTTLKNDVPDSTYIKQCVPLIQMQLHNAGLNLAKVLRSLYSTSH